MIGATGASVGESAERLPERVNVARSRRPVSGFMPPLSNKAKSSAFEALPSRRAVAGDIILSVAGGGGAAKTGAGAGASGAPIGFGTDSLIPSNAGDVNVVA